MLRVNDLESSYGNVRALKGISLEVHAGEIVTLIGANGAGKTTTLRTISGLLRPQAGKIEFLGREIGGLSSDRVVKLGIAQVPEGRMILSKMSVHENLLLGAHVRRDRAGIEQDLGKVQQLFPPLAERMQKPAATLSGGERQMLAIGRALMAHPKLLLMDEPSLGLAPRVVDEVFGTLVELNRQGTTILLVEQNARMALEVSRRGYVMEVGSIVLADTARNLLESSEVRKAYLGG
ncbi:MAG: ABC transporter ATP-binding protein [Candidatus Methylomirabilales bacterium]